MMKNILSAFLFVAFSVLSVLPSYGQAHFQNSGSMQVHNGGSMALDGNLINNGPFTSTGGTIHLLGSSSQTLMGSNTIQVNNLVLNNSAGAVAESEVQISGSLTFTNGTITTNRVDNSTVFIHFLDGSSFSGATDAKHIDGVVRKTGNDAFTFPVGDNNNLQPIGISAPSIVTDHFTAYYNAASPTGTYDITQKAISIHHVSNAEWWQMDRTNGTSQVKVTLAFDNISDVSDLSDLLVVGWNGVSWENRNNDQTTGVVSDGTIRSESLNVFGPFTLGSSLGNNPLPIELLDFDVTLLGSKALIVWKTASEINNDYFTVERSKDGADWYGIKKVNGFGNSSTILDYSVYDLNLLSGFSYYRIKQTDFDGQFSYSPVKMINTGSLGLKIYPNPTQGKIIVTREVSNANYFVIRNSMQQKVTAKTVHILNENMEIDLSNLPAGLYYITIDSETYKIVKQ